MNTNLLDRLVIPLLEWFAQNARDLPWRRDPTAYHVWLSEIMLQQTRVAAVLGYYTRFLDRAPTVAALAALSQDELLKLWQGLGYYSRARNLQKAAQIIMTDHNGVFPQSCAAIRALPGVGDYTAGAISSIAFNIPVPAVDGNVLRVTARITGDRRDITAAATKGAVAEALSKVLPVKAPGTFNQAMMELGATVCLPNGAPLCPQCPARHFCTAHLENTTHLLPVKAPKKPRRVEERTVYLLFFENRVALRRRPPKGLLAHLWEFPNELAHLPPPVAAPWQPGDTGKHIFTHIEWHMTAAVARTEDPTLPPGWVWATAHELAEVYAIPNAFSPFLPTVFRHLT